MKTFAANLKFQPRYNLQDDSVLNSIEFPVLTEKDGPRKARVTKAKPDGSGFGWDLTFTYDETSEA
jgi:hypothetical protein